MKVFLEKPIGMNYNECALISKSFHNYIFVGYNYRWNPQFIELSDYLNKGTIGKPYFASFSIGMNLEDWHPWEKYNEFFMSDKLQGGGALLDESHFIELIIELFGIPSAIFGIQNKISSLNINSDDYVYAQLQYKNLVVDLNLDLFKRPHESIIKIYGENGSLVCDFINKTIHVTYYQKYAQTYSTIKKFEYDRNQIFIDMMKDFLTFVNSNASKPKVPFSRGLQVMNLIDKIRVSSKSQLWVNLNAE
jgi:predicted dehydrogenase